MKEGFLIGAGLLATGEMLQLSAGPVVWELLAFPVNLILLALYVVLLGAVYALNDKVYAFRFIASPRAAVPALVYAVLLTAVMGLVRQTAAPHPADPVGLTRMLSYWPFVLIYVWLSLIVGLVALRQLVHFRWQRLPSLLSHAGLFVIIVAGTLGSADMQRLKMYCQKGQPEWRGVDDGGLMHELPIAIQLREFTMDEYAPKLTLVDGRTLQPLMRQGRPLVVAADSAGRQGTLGRWRLRVLRRLDMAAPKVIGDSMTYISWPARGATSAVQVEARLITGGAGLHHAEPATVRRGWVTCGSFAIPPEMLKLDNVYSLAMPRREPRRFASRVQVLTKAGENVETTIEVNKPADVGGWKIYQYSYDEERGRWSEVSVLELVTDPWLPFVYAGISLLALGSVLLFLTAGRRRVAKGVVSPSV